MTLDPQLEQSEVEFLAGFSSHGDIRRVWPGQPSPHCPWRVSPDGRTLDLDLELAAEDPTDVAPWLRFLCHEFLAPSSIDAMHTALAHRLRGGHQVSGTVVVGAHVISVDRNRISERVVVAEHEALVLPFDGDRRRDDNPSGTGQKRRAER